MNLYNRTELIQDSFCSITSRIFKALPHKLPFRLYKISNTTGRFTPVTVPNKMILSTDRHTISRDCDSGLIFIKYTDLTKNKQLFYQNLRISLEDLANSIPEQDLSHIIIEGLKLSANSIFVDSVKLNFAEFHATILALAHHIHESPDILRLLIPQLNRKHSLVNKSISCGIIGSAVILLGRENTPDLNIYTDSLLALFLCDIGMSNLPGFVLGKKFCLTLDEQKRIRQHSIASVELLSATQQLSNNTLRAILEHHERMDGSGYPRKVTNDKLSWLGKLCGVVDSYVAMTMERPGKKRILTVNALKNLYKESKKYDPNIVYALEKVTYTEG